MRRRAPSESAFKYSEVLSPIQLMEWDISVVAAYLCHQASDIGPIPMITFSCHLFIFDQALMNLNLNRPTFGNVSVLLLSILVQEKVEPSLQFASFVTRL